MKNLLLLFLFPVLTAAVFGQKTFDVQNFSEDYYGKVHIENPSEVFSKGWVAIYEKKTNRQLIKVVAEELTTPDEEKANVNVRELPYGEQSMIIYDDFNFDGIKDFAIMDGQNSCYHGPSFQIYLGGKVKNRFVLNKAFTQLAQDYCGMFDIDKETKTISTMVKSGCCWHQYSEFKVIGNKPRAVKIVEEDLAGMPFLNITTQKWNGKRMIKTTSRTVDFSESDEARVLVSFKTATGSEVVLFSYGEQLHYAFIDKSGSVDFAYPLDSGDEAQESAFTLGSDGNQTTLSFSNKKATYKIYETTDGKTGVQVTVGGKSSDIPGNPATRKGNLSKLAGEKLSNVTVKK